MLALLASLAALLAAAACRWSRRAGSTKSPQTPSAWRRDSSLCGRRAHRRGCARIDHRFDPPLRPPRADIAARGEPRVARPRDLRARGAPGGAMGPRRHVRPPGRANQLLGRLAAHGDTLVTAGSSGIASRCAGLHYAGVWSASRGDLLCFLDCESRVTAVATDGARVAVGCDDATVRVFIATARSSALWSSTSARRSSASTSAATRWRAAAATSRRRSVGSASGPLDGASATPRRSHRSRSSSAGCGAPPPTARRGFGWPGCLISRSRCRARAACRTRAR